MILEKEEEKAGPNPKIAACKEAGHRVPCKMVHVPLLQHISQVLISCKPRKPQAKQALIKGLVQQPEPPSATAPSHFLSRVIQPPARTTKRRAAQRLHSEEQNMKAPKLTRKTLGKAKCQEMRYGGDRTAQRRTRQQQQGRVSGWSGDNLPQLDQQA
jgi:hypothetical protein